ncbi:DUF4349 domain-containing protein [Marinagarivorans algicola]|nr:DUF4349 domain-containing protein [Marinagarivorans algicola]
MKQAEAEASQASFSPKRHIIQTASLTLSVENIDEKVNALSSLVEGYGGYVKSNNRYTEKRANLNIKIPSSKLDIFITEISNLGKVTSNSTSSRDVTDQVIDIDARMKNLIVLRARYRELLGKANTVKEVVSIEKELSKIQTEIDTIEGRRKSLLDQVAMSSVNVTFEQKTIYGPLGYIGKGLMWAIGKLFVIK